MNKMQRDCVETGGGYIITLIAERLSLLSLLLSPHVAQNPHFGSSNLQAAHAQQRFVVTSQFLKSYVNLMAPIFSHRITYIQLFQKWLS